MEKEELHKYNNRCAEFLGYVNTTPRDRDFNIYEKKNGELGFLIETMSMKFHSDWNWIMEIVEAIKTKIGVKTVDECSEEEWYITTGITRLYITSSKEAVIQAINRYLIWYGKNVS